MKGITLTQPWASLVAFGEKGVETRSWSTRYRGPLAIHAAMNLAPVGGLRGLRRLVEEEPFATALRVHLPGYTTDEIVAGLPRGFVVAVVNLNACRRIAADGEPERLLGDQLVWFSEIHPHERRFGDYTPGRYAWHLTERQRIEPVECHGARGLWDVPALARRALEAQEGDWEIARDAALVSEEMAEERKLDQALRQRPC